MANFRSQSRGYSSPKKAENILATSNKQQIEREAEDVFRSKLAVFQSQCTNMQYFHQVPERNFLPFSSYLFQTVDWKLYHYKFNILLATEYSRYSNITSQKIAFFWMK